MRKFRITIALCVIMAFVVPIPGLFAVSETSPAYTHFIYMLGHAGWIHYLINIWTLLVLHNLLRWYRVIVAYGWAVLESYVLLPDQPMVGLSVFNCVFIGFVAPWLWRRDRLTVLLTIVLLLLTCVVSGLAGIQHVASFCFGVVFCLAEGKIRSLCNYIRD